MDICFTRTRNTVEYSISEAVFLQRMPKEYNVSSRGWLFIRHLVLEMSKV